MHKYVKVLLQQIAWIINTYNTHHATIEFRRSGARGIINGILEQYLTFWGVVRILLPTFYRTDDTALSDTGR